MPTKLFPEYLNQGSKGPAVNLLGLLMQVACYGGGDKPIVLDGEYTPDGAIASAVKAFQEDVGLSGTDIDGNFGPKTRAKFKEVFDVDVDELTIEMFVGETVAVGP